MATLSQKIHELDLALKMKLSPASYELTTKHLQAIIKLVNEDVSPAATPVAIEALSASDWAWLRRLSVASIYAWNEGIDGSIDSAEYAQFTNAVRKLIERGYVVAEPPGSPEDGEPVEGYHITVKGRAVLPPAPARAADDAAKAAPEMKCYPDKHQYVEVTDGVFGIGGTAIPYQRCTVCNHVEVYHDDTEDLQEYMTARSNYLVAKLPRLAPTHMNSLTRLAKGEIARRNWQRSTYYKWAGMDRLLKMGYASEVRSGDFYRAVITDKGHAYLAVLAAQGEGR